ncbi:MAG: phosphatase PAP2 family protein [Prevotella sp.]|nr:phosphatase PAP2 family protein [Prevotella sp.]MDD7047251.1 phosphatase PAP2 family protein [Prevotella sp.]MDY5545827.1 phosphatase PAP2 family protein [Prevotella sp.]
MMLLTDLGILHFFNGSNSLFYDTLVQVLTSGFTWIPLYLALFYLVIKNNETMVQIGLAIGCAVLCVVLSGGIDDMIVKPLVARLRPTVDPHVKFTIDIVNGITEAKQFSFFSAHAANTFTIAAFFALLVRSRLLNAALFTWALLNGWTRLYLGVHYPSDVLIGILWGCVVAVLVYWFYFRTYRRISPALNYVSSQYTVTGYNRGDIDIVLTVLMFTYLYAVVRTVVII